MSSDVSSFQSDDHDTQEKTRSHATVLLPGCNTGCTKTILIIQLKNNLNFITSAILQAAHTNDYFFLLYFTSIDTFLFSFSTPRFVISSCNERWEIRLRETEVPEEPRVLHQKETRAISR